jgi:hypothetical protein
MPRISRLLGPSRQGPEECPAALLTRRFDASGQRCGTGERRGALQKVQPLQPRLHNPLDAPAKRRAANRHAMARWLLVRRRSPLGFASKSECAVSKAQKMSTRLAPSPRSCYENGRGVKNASRAAEYATGSSAPPLLRLLANSSCGRKCKAFTITEKRYFCV